MPLDTGIFVIAVTRNRRFCAMVVSNELFVMSGITEDPAKETVIIVYDT